MHEMVTIGDHQLTSILFHEMHLEKASHPISVVQSIFIHIYENSELTISSKF